MDITLILYGLAVAWFTYTCFRIAGLIYQFEMFPSNYGRTPAISLRDLERFARHKNRDLPSFRVVVPAYQESAVIEATANRLASLNYPRTHFDIHVVTYEDEPAMVGLDSTYVVASQAAERINARAERPLVTPLLVPTDFDGNFPGSLGADERFIGKARGLNYALRTIHEDNERDERSHYIACMAEFGHLAVADKALCELSDAFGHADQLHEIVRERFDPTSPEYIGALALSSHFERVLASSVANYLCHEDDAAYARTRQLLCAYVEAEAPRFFLDVRWPKPQGGEPQGVMSTPDSCARVMAGKEFLHQIMRQVEDTDLSDLCIQSQARTRVLERERPRLAHALAQARTGDEIYQLTRRMNSRWLLVYDADADAPADLLRYLAARILDTPAVMGFQGPVAPVANYDEVHPLCRLGGLWMGFWHATNYPRLLHRTTWAHPLAGTNWCFHIEGMERDGQLIRDCPYDESARRFVLTFDPEQLTEDLEAGIRIFSDWRINAEWHPFVEFEQVPPTPRAMIVQRTRWTLGTLQTLRYILQSNLPRLQKLRFAVHPLEIMVSGSGPVITLFLWILMLAGQLEDRPLFATWTVILTVGNLLYVLSFLRAYSHFDGVHKRANAFEYLRVHGEELASDLHRHARQHGLRGRQLAQIEKLSITLERALGRRGFIARYLRGRCLDEQPDVDRSDTHDTHDKSQELERLLQATPTRLHGHDLDSVAAALRDLRNQTPTDQQEEPAKELFERVHAMQYALAEGGGTTPWRGRRIRNRVQIWVWTFPYLFFQLVPYFKGLWRWLRGKRESHWHKTPRTPKATFAASRLIAEGSAGPTPQAEVEPAGRDHGIGAPS